jgi:hypothetical protein
MAKGRKGIKKVTRRKPVSNPFLEPDSPTVQEAGEVEVPSSSPYCRGNILLYVIATSGSMTTY